MQNKKRKRELLESGIFEKYCKLRYTYFKQFKLNIYQNIYEQYEEIRKIIPINFFDFKCCEQMRKCKSAQRKEISTRLNYWILNGYEIIFSTYTLNEETWNRYTYDNEFNKQLQDILTRKLKKYCIDYIGNIDYGTENGRLHYHVLQAHKKGTIKEEIKKCNLNKCIYENKDSKNKILEVTTPINIEWNKYGFNTNEIVEMGSGNFERLPYYITKLTNHSLKKKYNYLITKRNSDFNAYKKLLCATTNTSYYKHFDVMSEYVLGY